MPKAPVLPELHGLSELTRWIADTYHEGVLLPIAEKLGVSSAVVYQWEKGQTRTGHPATLSRLAEAYGLDLGDVLRVVTKPRRASVSLRAMSDKGRPRVRRNYRNNYGQRWSMRGIMSTRRARRMRRRLRIGVHHHDTLPACA